jgi:hypothetical protein
VRGLAHCSRDLGRANDAVTYASTALAGAGASERSDFFVTMVLADGHLSGDNLDQACATVQEILPGLANSSPLDLSGTSATSGAVCGRTLTTPP